MTHPSSILSKFNHNLAAIYAKDNTRILEDVGVATNSLTPEMLLLYCKKRLGGLDLEIKNAMDKQQRMNGIKNEISAIQSKLSGLQNGNASPKDIAELNDQLDHLLEQVPADTPLGKELLDAKTKLNEDGQGGTDAIVTGDDIKSMQDSLKQASATMDSDAELEMMQLQSVMSQRQTAIQLTTNLIQTMNESVRKVAENIGH